MRWYVFAAFWALLAVILPSYAQNNISPLLSNSTPGWVQPGAIIDLNFANGTYWVNGRNAAPSAFLTLTRATAETCQTRGGVLFYAASGFPCITDLGLGSWKTATNLLLQSQFAATWTATRSTLTANAVASPDLTTDAATLIEDATATSTHVTLQSKVKAASALAYTYTVYAKASTRTRIMLEMDDGAGNGATAGFDLSGGQIAYAAAGLGVAFTAISGSISPMANGWYRCELQATSNTAVAVVSNVFLDNGAGTAAQSTSYSGDGVSGVAIFGAQLEQSNYSTPYIPTTTAAVTRNTDALSVSLTGITTTLISVGGAWMFQGNQTSANATFRSALALDDGATTDYIAMTHSTAAIVRFEANVANVATAYVPNASTTTTTSFKYAQSWNTTTVNGSPNGTAVSSASATFPAITGTIWRIGCDIGASDGWNGYVARATLFNAPLQAAQIRNMTAFGF